MCHGGDLQKYVTLCFNEHTRSSQGVYYYSFIFPDFKESLPLVDASIKKADFIVIDAEFTGLINGPEVSMFDSPAEYYLRSLAGCKDFLLIQYGLCAFYWDEQTDQYMNDAYNFYLFPRGRPGPERTFLCQSSSLDFLASQGFDFNKLIREGEFFIFFLSKTNECNKKILNSVM